MEQLFGAIPVVIGGLETHAKLDEAVVFAAWSRHAGELLSERTVPIEYGKKRLIVAVSDKTWQRHLEDLSPQMIAKINASLGVGTIRFIEFKVDEEAVTKTRKKDVSKRHNGPDALSSGLKRAAMAIADEELRKHFLDTAGDYLAKQRRNSSEI